MILFSKRESISLRVPHWNFVALTRPRDAQRIYLRVKNDEQSKIKTNTHSTSNLLSVPYNQLKTEAEEIVSLKHIPFVSANCSNFNHINIVRILSLFIDSKEC